MTLTIAYFTPLPPQRSGIADYSATLLPNLAERCAVEIYVDEPEQIEPMWAQRFRLHSIADFLTSPSLRWRHDICLYHMGNQPLFHEQIYQALIRYPGIVVLHEVGLFGFYLHRRSTGEGFVREMGYAFGLKGTQTARAILRAGLAYQAQAYPLFNRIVEVSQGVIVHTDAARKRILHEVPHARVIHIPLAAHDPAPYDRLAGRIGWRSCPQMPWCWGHLAILQCQSVSILYCVPSPACEKSFPNYTIC